MRLFLYAALGIDPYIGIIIVVPGSFYFWYVLYRFMIGKLAHGDQNILLITLGLSIIFENMAMLFFFSADQRTVNLLIALKLLILALSYFPFQNSYRFLHH